VARGLWRRCKVWRVGCKCDRVHAPLLRVRSLCSECAGRRRGAGKTLLGREARAKHC
jgi:hypothetical protein